MLASAGAHAVSLAFFMIFVAACAFHGGHPWVRPVLGLGCKPPPIHRSSRIVVVAWWQLCSPGLATSHVSIPRARARRAASWFRCGFLYLSLCRILLPLFLSSRVSARGNGCPTYKITHESGKASL